MVNARISTNNGEKNFSKSSAPTTGGLGWLSATCSTVISYDTHTTITFGGSGTIGSGSSATSFTGRYRYQILLIPEGD